MTRLLLVRHGQSEWNAIGRWQGQADPPLSDLGERQAELAARNLGPIDAIVTSDLVRARRTAEIVADHLGVNAPELEPGLRERDAGDWSGLTRAEIEQGWPGYLTGRQRPAGFESDESVLRRALAAVDRVTAAHRGSIVLVVTHGGVVYAVEQHLGTHEWEPLANLAGRWVEDDGAGRRLGPRVLLVDPDDVAVTVPGQL